MAFVGKVRDKLAEKVKQEEAVRQAVDECITENVLTDFFKERREEIVEREYRKYEIKPFFH